MTTAVLTNTDIIKEIWKSDNVDKDSDEDEEGKVDNTVNIPSAMETTLAVNKIYIFVKANSSTKMLLNSIDELENFAENNIIKNCVCKRITDFFYTK